MMRSIIASFFTALAAMPSMSVDADDKINFDPIGRATFNWSYGSNKSDQLTFNTLEFGGVDAGGKISFGKAFSVKAHASINEDDLKFKDLYLEVPVGNIRYVIGNSKVPNLFTWQFSGTAQNFIERPTLRRAFGVARMFGLRATSNGDDWGWAAGIFKGDVNETALSSDWVAAVRAYWGVSFGELNGFLGGSVRYRGNAPEHYNYAERPYTFAVAKLVNYRGGNSDTMAASEAAFQYGALYGVAEGAFLWTNSSVETGHSDTLFGGYIELGYNLTGEITKFDFKRGSFGKTKVASPVTSGGPGLWQVSMRYDHLNLTAKDASQSSLKGGQQGTFIVGLNWQANKHMRLLANYSRSSISHMGVLTDRIDAVSIRLIFFL